MKFQALFNILALLTLTSLGLSFPAQFNFEYPGDWTCASHLPLTYGSCWTGTPIPDGTMLTIYVNSAPFDSFAMNSQDICGEPIGGFFVQWYMTVANPGDSVYLEVEYEYCRYWTNPCTLVVGPQTFALIEADWNCDCGPPAPCYFVYPGDRDCAYPPDRPLTYGGGCWEGAAIPDGTPVKVYKNGVLCDSFPMNSDSICDPPTHDGGFFVQLDSCVGYDGDSLYCEVEYENYRYRTDTFVVANAPTPKYFLLTESDWFCECSGLSGPLSGILGPGVYHVCDTIRVDPGNSLQLMPGTTFTFDGPYPFKIYGTLLAEGTEDSSIVFTNCVANSDRWRGLRFYSGSSGSRLAYCVIENGLATGNWPDNAGGAVYCYSSSPSFANCNIAGNEGYEGGAVLCESYSSPHFTYCVFSGNFANGDGGGVSCEWHSSPHFKNCTFTANLAHGNGGGIACYGYSSPIDSNTIIWGNCADVLGDEVYLGAGSSIAFTCCDVCAAGIGGPGTPIWQGINICADPLFCDPDTCANAPTIAGDYALKDGKWWQNPQTQDTIWVCSPCGPSANPQCGLIGALGPGCNFVPDSVSDLVIDTNRVDANLHWSRVHTSMCGTPIDVNYYLVYYSEYADGPFFYHGYVVDSLCLDDTCRYTHFGVVWLHHAMHYYVTAYLGSIGPLLSALAELGEHPQQEDLSAYLRRAAFLPAEKSEFRAPALRPH